MVKKPWPASITKQQIKFESKVQSGVRFHQLIHRYFLNLSTERLLSLNDKDSDIDLTRWWNNFLIFAETQKYLNSFSEIVLQTRLADQQLLAKYDLITIINSKYVIFDWKTNQKPLIYSDLIEHLQSKIYHFVLWKTFSSLKQIQITDPSQIIMIYWQANFPDHSITINYSNSDLQKNMNQLKNLINLIVNLEEKDFVMTDNLHNCQLCVYKSSCNRLVSPADFNDLIDHYVEGYFPPFDLEIDNGEE